MSGSTVTPAPMRPNDVSGSAGRYLIVQPSGAFPLCPKRRASMFSVCW